MIDTKQIFNGYPPTRDLFSVSESQTDTLFEEVSQNETLLAVAAAAEHGVEPVEAVTPVQQQQSALDVMSFDLSPDAAKKPYIPFKPGSSDAPQWANAFLEQLVDNNGFITRSAEATGVARSTVWAAGQRFPMFAAQIEQVRDYWRDVHLDQLEALSISQAMKPGNITERILQLKQHSPRYRDRGKNEEPTKINVTVGINIPKADYNRVTTDAEVE